MNGFDERWRRAAERSRRLRGPEYFQRLRRYVKLAEYAKAILDSGASWETKYHIIFSPDVSGQFPRLDYFDPDTSYEEDVRAYVKALQEQASEWSIVLKAIDSTEGATDE